LVTHDRYMLDRVSTVVLGLDGLGHCERFADYSQWDSWQRAQSALAKANALAAAKVLSQPSERGATTPAKKKLSYKEAREFETIEQRIVDAEKELQAKHDSLFDPNVVSDSNRLRALTLEMEAAQKAIDNLYARWAELEQKRS